MLLLLHNRFYQLFGTLGVSWPMTQSFSPSRPADLNA
jgi:hypothetical protein